MKIIFFQISIRQSWETKLCAQKCMRGASPRPPGPLLDAPLIGFPTSALVDYDICISSTELPVAENKHGHKR
jgi:hypothetical protein